MSVQKLLRKRAICLAVLCGLNGGVTAAFGADYTERQIAQQLMQASPSNPLNFNDADLTNLDLSGLDFKQAKFVGTDLFGVDLSGANMTGTDLRGSRLDRIVMIEAKFDRANFTGATLLRPSLFRTLDPNVGIGPSFAGANFTGVKMFGRFNRANFSGANFTRAKLAPFGRTGFIEHIWRTELLGANLSNAILKDADLSQVLLAFANLKGADLRGANLQRADLTQADLTGANLTGADFTDADLDRAKLNGVTGMDSVIGLSKAKNYSPDHPNPLAN